MLGFQRSVVFLYHQAGHIAHHLLVALHLALALETLVQDEVVVALKSMTVDAGVIIAMVGDEFLQFHGGIGQVVNVEGDVFDQA